MFELLWNLIFKKKEKEETSVTAQEQLLADELKKKKEEEKAKEPEPTAKEKEKKAKEEKKEKEKEEKRQKKEEKRKEMKTRLIMLGAVLLTFTLIYLVPISFANLFGKEVVLYARITEDQENSRLFLTYEFEGDLNNIYSDTKSGDKIPLNKMLWGTDVASKIEVVDIQEDGFTTELPHILQLGSSAYNDYFDNRRPGRAKLTLKVTAWKQVITKLEI